MPNPALIGLAGGLGSSLIGSRSASNAANEQADATQKGIDLQSKMFDRTDALQSGLYDEQKGTIHQYDPKIRGAIGSAFKRSMGTAGDLRDQGLAGNRGTTNQNRTLNENALRQGNQTAGVNQRSTINASNLAFNRGEGRAMDTRTANVSDYRREMGGGTRRILNDRNVNISDLRREEGGGTRRLVNAGDQNIAGYQNALKADTRNFQPNIDLGNQGTSAYAYNLGIGDKPSDYSGLTESAGTKYLMNTGRQEIEGGAAGAGGLYSGATLAALEKKREGLASLDKDNQQSQLIALGGLGQNAANSLASSRSNYTGRIGDTRTGVAQDVNSLRNNYTGQINDQRTGATSDINTIRGKYAGMIGGERSDYRDTTNALDATRTGDVIDARNLGTATRLGLQDQYTGRGIDINNTFNANRYGMLGDYAGSATNAANNRTEHLTGQYNNMIENLGTARSNRANLYGSAASKYATNAADGYSDIGAARANGAIGSTNALLGGAAQGLQLYGQMGGTFGQGGTGGTGNPFANIANWFRR